MLNLELLVFSCGANRPVAQQLDVDGRQAPVRYRSNLRGYALDPDPFPLDAGIGDGDEPDLLVAGGDIGYVDPEHFQAFFELFDGEIVVLQHGGDPFELVG